MFTKSAQFYDALYRFKDYSNASQQLRLLIDGHNPDAKNLLDVGCGTGKHIEHLQFHYDVEGLDLDPQLLEIAKRRCPNVDFFEKDMVDFSLAKTFDVITCLFSAIAYVKNVENLRRAISRMEHHLKPGGLLVVEPWIAPEKYRVGAITANFVDEPELKIAWMYLSEIDGTVSIFDIHYLIATPVGIDSFKERHEMGLFTHQEYLDSFSMVGLKVSYDAEGFFGRGMYVGRKAPNI
jgi:SAM-dependent methyltransferase